MGKATYDHVLKLTSDFPYHDKKCYVFSRSSQGKDQYVEFVNESVASFLNNLNQETKKIWLVGGADILADFLKAKRVDEFIISVIPVLLGAGIPLFKRGIPEMNLKLTRYKAVRANCSALLRKKNKLFVIKTLSVVSVCSSCI